MGPPATFQFFTAGDVSAGTLIIITLGAGGGFRRFASARTRSPRCLGASPSGWCESPRWATSTTPGTPFALPALAPAYVLGRPRFLLVQADVNRTSASDAGNPTVVGAPQKRDGDRSASIHIPSRSLGRWRRPSRPPFATLLVAVALLSTRDRSGRGPSAGRQHHALQQRAEALRGERRLDDALDSTVRSPLMPPPTSWTGLAGQTRGLDWPPRDRESLFVALLQERPEDYDSRIGLADVRLWLGRHDAAEGRPRGARPDPSGRRRRPLSAGRVRETEGDPRGATRYFHQALRADSGHADARAALRRVAALALGDGTGVLRRPAVRRRASNGGTASSRLVPRAACDGGRRPQCRRSSPGPPPPPAVKPMLDTRTAGQQSVRPA